MMLYRNVLGPCLMPSQGRPLLSVPARWPVRTRTPHIISLAPAKVILSTTDQVQPPLFGATGPVPQRTRSSVLCDGPVSLASLSPAFRHSNGPVPAFQHCRSFATSANTEKAARDDESYIETINRYWKLLQEGRRAARARGTVRTGVLQLAQKAGLLSATRPDPDLPSELEHLFALAQTADRHRV
ncbi:hypothetical protein AAT19DRAFT_11483 [Rhodotorula toruloides]|uniref:Uncharacterized protein n=1 Tax=Rhodotorula toruloides TaxID=5286 RepID=A0A2S9ZWX2_RHOTO|nr:hypothetical protein AAT19DRAFT_11483 [Rhodotorula toruloides]